MASNQKTYPELVEAIDIEDGDLIATYRAPGPLKRTTISALRTFTSGDKANKDGTGLTLDEADSFREAIRAAGPVVDSIAASDIQAGTDAVWEGETKYSRSSIASILTRISPTPEAAVLAYVPMNGPAGYATAYDLSSYSRAVTSFADVKVSGGQSVLGQNAMYFDGTGDRIDVADSPDFAFGSGDFTLAGWAMVEDLAATRFIIGHHSNSTNYHALFVNADGSISYQAVSGVNVMIDATSMAGVISAGEWYHIAVCRKGTDFKVYVNRFVVATATGSFSIPDYTNDLRIGAFPTVGSWRGWLSRWQIMNVAMWETGYMVIDQIPGPPWPNELYQLLPPQSYKQDAQGGWWLLDESPVTPEMFGAVGDGAFTATSATGTDNYPALYAMNAYMQVVGVEGQIKHSRYYLCGQEFVQSARHLITGVGKTCGIITRMNAYEVGVRLYGAGFRQVALIAGAYQARGPGRGDRHTNVTSGDQKFVNGTPIFTDDALLEDVHLWKINLGHSPGHGIMCQTSTRGLTINRVTGEGSPRPHNTFFMAHWGGTGEGDYFGVTKTYHNNKIRIIDMTVDASTNGIALSSAYNVKIDRVTIRNTQRAVFIFAGDETNAFAAQPNMVGRGMTITDLFIENMENEATQTEIISITGIGASTFRSFPSPDEAINDGRLRAEMEYSLDIENINIIGSPNAGKMALRCYGVKGTTRIGTLMLRDVAGVAGLIRDSDGIIIERLDVETSNASNGFTITRSSGVSVGGRMYNTQFDTGYGVVVTGSRETVALDGAINAGDTEILLNAPYTNQIRVGQPLTIGGIRVYATAWRDAGCLRIPITPCPAARSDGANVVADWRCENIDLDVHTYGWARGYNLGACVANITGVAEAAGQFGIRCDGNATVTLKGCHFINNGLTRASAGTTITADLYIDPDAAISDFGSIYGIGSTYVLHNVRATGTTTLDNRYVGVGSRSRAFITGFINATSANDYKVTNCINPDGTLVT